ncbi:MAG: Smr/MutS family protein [Proteobacteria bacterium]|nr:Smr/MutS family protein [Pseudomonadota bacterium]
MTDKQLTEQEKALFAEAMKNVRPLKSSSKILPAIKPKLKNKVKVASTSQTSQIDQQYLPVDLETLALEDWVGIEDKISFYKAGLQHSVIKKLAQGKMPIQSRLDLHQLTVAEAIDQADAFLKNCQQQQIRSALIIHGKGKMSHKPILKNAINVWLRTHPAVLAFHTAQLKHGGSGAIYVLISQASSKVPNAELGCN